MTPMVPMLPTPSPSQTPRPLTPLDTDLVLDQLVDECHVTQVWLRDTLAAAAEAVEEDAVDDAAYRRGPDPDRSAWTIVMSLLTRDLRTLPEPVLHRLGARVPALGRDLDPIQYEADGSSLLCRLLAVAATKMAADTGDPAGGPDLARSLVEELHHRLRVCNGCIEWLAGLREGLLVRRSTPRDTRLAGRTFDEALNLLRGDWR